MKFYKKIAAIICLGLSLNAVAAKATEGNDYNSGAYTDEGKILVKFRALFASTEGAVKGLPATTSGNPIPSVRFLTNGAGLENANTIFFTERLAAEVTLGINSYNVSRSSLNKIAADYGNNSGIEPKKRLLVGIPASMTMQFHIAPFGAIRPYVGGGYGATYFFSRAAEFKIKPAHGSIFQAGVDIVMTNDSLINLDIRKYNLSPKITYKKSLLGAGSQPISSKLQISPWTIALGIGFKL